MQDTATVFMLQPADCGNTPTPPRRSPIASRPHRPGTGTASTFPSPIHLPPAPIAPQASCMACPPIASRSPAPRQAPRATSHPAASRGADQTPRTKCHPEAASPNSPSTPQTRTPPHDAHSPPSTYVSCRARGSPRRHPATKRHDAQQPAPNPAGHAAKASPPKASPGAPP